MHKLIAKPSAESAQVVCNGVSLSYVVTPHLSLVIRMVLDGWPLTMKQVELLKSHHILPAIFVALQVSEEECERRAEEQSSQALRYKGRWK